MDFDYLRLISLDERDNGKLTSISSDTFDMAREYIAELCEEAKSGDNFMTKRGTELIEEIESVQSVLQSIIDLRVKKIIKLAEDLSKTGRSDKEQIKRMTPAEKQMYDEILAAISRCRDTLNAVIPAGTATGAAGTASPQTKTATTAASASYASSVPDAMNETETESLFGGTSATAEQTPSVTGSADAAYAENADNTGTANPVNAAGGEIGAQTSSDGVAAADAGTDAGSDAAESSESAAYADPLDNVDADIWDDADFRDFAAQSAATTETAAAANASSDAAKTAGTATTAGNAATGADNPPIDYELLCVKRDIDSFMGIDNKIYTISAGDILTLPVDNARVLRDRNIALNIKVSK
ncbi:MAG: DNA replication complex GINS family protein [Methanomicrobium sp.]|nr:DNA replication complex GINS family protein [Methanomicrobium sp.]